MRRALGLALAIAMVGGGCAEGVPPGCAPLERLATPVSGDDMVRLQALADAVALEMGNREWNINMVDADEMRGTVVVGVQDPSVVTCVALRSKFGPLIEVVQQDPYVPL